MTYIYDILLNFNEDFYEFYEWEKQDKIFHVKKIPLFKVDTEVIEDIIYKKIKLNNSINLKTELFGNKNNKYINSCLLTDGYKVIGIKVNDNMIIDKISDLLLDESVDTINIGSRLNKINLEYNIIGSKKSNIFLTRNEKEIKQYLENELKKILKNNENDKLEYLYFEYFNKYNKDRKLIYKELIKSLKDKVTDKHLNIYNLLNLKEECHNINK